MTYHTFQSLKAKLTKGDFVEVHGGMAGPVAFSGYCIELYANALVLQEMRRIEDYDYIEGPARSFEFSENKYTAVIYKPIQ